MNKEQMLKSILFVIAASLGLLVAGCDKVNNASRALDTMLGGDFDVYVQGHEAIYRVEGGKITSVPEKGYYVFYPTINGEKRLVQSPIQITTIVERSSK